MLVASPECGGGRESLCNQRKVLTATGIKVLQKTTALSQAVGPFAVYTSRPIVVARLLERHFTPCVTSTMLARLGLQFTYCTNQVT